MYIEITKEEFDQRVSALTLAFPEQFAHLKKVQIPSGWLDRFEWICLRIEEMIEQRNHKDSFSWHLVDESMGQLRAEFNFSGDEILKNDINWMLEMAITKSKRVCHRCGRNGIMVSLGGWYIPICKTHLRDEKKSRDVEVELL